jgi:hypothetical protein
MRKLIALAVVGLALGAFGCAGMQSKDQMITKETKIKCPKCGAEFTVQEGLSAMEKTR